MMSLPFWVKLAGPLLLVAALYGYHQWQLGRAYDDGRAAERAVWVAKNLEAKLAARDEQLRWARESDAHSRALLERLRAERDATEAGLAEARAAAARARAAGDRCLPETLPEEPWNALRDALRGGEPADRLR